MKYRAVVRSCKHGHALTGDNVLITKEKNRRGGVAIRGRCKECFYGYVKKYQEKIGVQVINLRTRNYRQSNAEKVRQKDKKRKLALKQKLLKGKRCRFCLSDLLLGRRGAVHCIECIRDGSARKYDQKILARKIRAAKKSLLYENPLPNLPRKSIEPPQTPPPPCRRGL